MYAWRVCIVHGTFTRAYNLVFTKRTGFRKGKKNPKPERIEERMCVYTLIDMEKKEKHIVATDLCTSDRQRTTQSIPTIIVYRRCIQLHSRRHRSSGAHASPRAIRNETTSVIIIIIYIIACMLQTRNEPERGTAHSFGIYSYVTSRLHRSIPTVPLTQHSRE